MRRLFCWFNTIIQTIIHLPTLIARGHYGMSGHTWKETEESGKYRIVTILKCEFCKKQDVSLE